MLLKSFFAFLLAITLTNHAKADQLAVITQAEAISAVDYLQSQTSVILWCGCCDADPMRTVYITEVFYAEAGITDENGEMLYTVYINGIDQDGLEVIGEGLDLAYVHVNENNVAYCLGIQLGMACDPCVDPFSFE